MIKLCPLVCQEMISKSKANNRNITQHVNFLTWLNQNPLKNLNIMLSLLKTKIKEMTMINLDWCANHICQHATSQGFTTRRLIEIPTKKCPKVFSSTPTEKENVKLVNILYLFQPVFQILLHPVQTATEFYHHP